MDFSLPVSAAELDGKKLTMLYDVTLNDCIDHLRAATDIEGTVLHVNENGRLYDGFDEFNSVSCSGKEITFGDVSTGPTITAFTWE